LWERAFKKFVSTKTITVCGKKSGRKRKREREKERERERERERDEGPDEKQLLHCNNFNGITNESISGV